MGGLADNRAGYTTSEELRRVLQQARPAPQPLPRPTPYDGGWNGKHCAFIYTATTLLDWPVVPTFKRGEQE